MAGVWPLFKVGSSIRRKEKNEWRSAQSDLYFAPSENRRGGIFPSETLFLGPDSPAKAQAYVEVRAVEAAIVTLRRLLPAIYRIEERVGTIAEAELCVMIEH